MRIRNVSAATITGVGSLALATAGVIASPAAPARADTCSIANSTGGTITYHPPYIDGGGAQHWSCNTSPVYDWAGWAKFSHCSVFPQGCSAPVANDAGGASDYNTLPWHIYSQADFNGAETIVYSGSSFGASLGYLRNNNRSARWG